MITSQNSSCNPHSSFVAPNSSVRNRLEHTRASCTFEKLITNAVAKNVNNFADLFNKKDIELIRFLHSFHKNHDGRISPKIKNMANKIKVSLRTVHYMLAKLKKHFVLITLKGGYGQKAAVRTFTDRGILLIRKLFSPDFINQQAANRNLADYFADYLGGTTNYISTKGDILQSNPVSQEVKQEKKSVFETLRWLNASP